MSILSFAGSTVSEAGWKDYLALCKLKVVAVMLLTLVVGFCLAEPGMPSLPLLLITGMGVGLAAASAAAVNHVLDTISIAAWRGRQDGRCRRGGSVRAMHSCLRR